MKAAVLFDLGNTLAAYYRSDEFLPILETAIGSLVTELHSLNLCRVPFDTALESAITQNREAPDFRLIPMTDRFERIFEISLAEDEDLRTRLCRRFLEPIFSIGRVYPDSLPIINQLRAAGHPLAIVSNAPWGSPPDLWREELARMGLASAVDAVVLCGDVGWRKPALRIFEFAATSLDCSPDQCIFVGDDLQWDIAGSKAAGMRSVLIDRKMRNRHYAGERIEDLYELPAIVDSQRGSAE